MSEPFQIAIARSVFAGLISFGLTALVTYQVTHSWSAGLVAGGIAGLTQLGTRGAAEGLIDTVKAGPSAPQG